MTDPKRTFVTTIEEHCRVCYTCVRECPAKAIRIANGQAEVVPERCVGCGNCVRVCSQGAKQVCSSRQQVLDLLSGHEPVAAVIAPSFPAEFGDTGYKLVVGMVRALGFDYVNEVAFGADLVAREYGRLMQESPERYVATSCPAIVGFVERYHPDLVPALAPIVSPMVATARALRQMHGDGLHVVFIGPCIAKKGEADGQAVINEVDAVLTFAELNDMLYAASVDVNVVTPSEFDEPHGGLGAIFPITGGMLQTAAIDEDLVQGTVVCADGRTDFVQALKAFEAGDLDVRLLEVLCCNGCIMGAGISTNAPRYSRRSRVSRYVRQRAEAMDQDQWQQQMARFAELDLRRAYRVNDQRVDEPSRHELAEIFARMGKFAPEDQLNCGACGYDTCREHAVAIYKGLAESEMCLPYTIEELKTTVQQLHSSNEQLAQTQQALMHSEKLASMGQLAAGIAHELNNPLGVVLMYAHLLLEQVQEQETVGEDVEMIVEQADRCKKIVSGLLHFARQNKVVREPVDVHELVKSALATIREDGGVQIVVEHQVDDPVVELDRDQFIQVITNLVSNAQSAMPDGGTITVRTEDDPHEMRISVHDTGSGIPEQNLDKIFEPFFTTKQIGKGTGLGLAVTYGIIKMHSGDIQVESNEDPGEGPTWTRFTVKVPRREAAERVPRTDSHSQLLGKPTQ